MTAILFQSMPPLAPEEYAALEASIREHGIQVPILVDEAGTVIDGHHRQKIAAELDIVCPTRTLMGGSEAEKRTLALSLNLDRRHLSREQRRALVAESVKADPELSNREHARRTGVHHETAAAVRGELEGRGEIRHVPERTDSLGRLQPSVKPRQPAPLEGTAEIPQLESTVGADGKQRPSVKPRPPATDRPKPRRRPITDSFNDAREHIDRQLVTLTNLIHDDRFNTNATALAARNYVRLQQTASTLAEVLAALEPHAQWVRNSTDEEHTE